MAQAKGRSTQLLGHVKETAYRTPPGSPSATILPFISASLRSAKPNIESGIIRSQRADVRPSRGNKDVSGDVVIPVDAAHIGYWLQMVLGDPTTTQESSQNIDNAAAVDKGGGKVGIPVTGHGYLPGAPITIAGTTNYNGNYTVDDDTTTNEVVIVDTYAAETFAGTETIQGRIYTHVFKPADSLDSWQVEIGYTDITQYLLYGGVKASGISMTFDQLAEQELQATVPLVGGDETTGTSSMDGTPDSNSIEMFEVGDFAEVQLDAVVNSDVQSVTMEINNGLDENGYYLGDDERLQLPAGKVTVTGTIRMSFQDLVEYNQALAATEKSLQIKVETPHASGDWYQTLTILIPELILEAASPGVETQEGIMIELPFRAYYDDSAEGNILQATIVNRIASY